MASKRPVTTPQDWAKRLQDVPLSKHDLNLLVANYLFTEGYLSAAENFAREAGLSSASSTVGGGALDTTLSDVDSIRSRMAIRRAVLRGDVESALDQVVDLDLEILDLDPSLHFHLLQQHLIELIRAGEVDHALTFAQHELAPLAEEHPKFLKELERTMALLAFELPVLGVGSEGSAPGSGESARAKADGAAGAGAISSSTGGKKSKKSSSSSGAKGASKGPSADAGAATGLPPMPAHISSLLDPSQRLRTARELNAAILQAQGHAAEPKLPALMSVMTWGEGLLADKGVEWPKWDLHALLVDAKSSDTAMTS